MSQANDSPPCSAAGIAAARTEDGAQVKLTPMLEQYLEIKSKNPDALLLYRMGDFYELFFEDARIASRELQIALTTRNPNAKDAVPMAGVPHHAIDVYLPQLLEKGYNVAICDQTEDPRMAKGLVARAVTRVLTPATVVEDINLDAKSHTYLGAYSLSEKNGGGFAWLDLSTGEWSGVSLNNEGDLLQWILKIRPRELLVSDNAKVPQSLAASEMRLVRLPEQTFYDQKRAQREIIQAQGVRELSALGLEGKPELVKACGALLFYSEQTQKQEVTHLRQFKIVNPGRFLILDEITERNLELFRRLDGKKGIGTLWHVLDETVTPMGGRLLGERLRNPWRELAPIEKTQNAVDWFFQNSDTRERLRKAMDKVYDLERLSSRIHLNRATPKDFVALRETLLALPHIRKVLERAFLPEDRYPTGKDVAGAHVPGFMTEIFKSWDNLEDYAELLEKSLVDCPPTSLSEGGLFRLGYDARLDKLINLTDNGQSEIQALYAREKENNNLPKLKLGFTRAFGYYFELSRAVSTPVPEHFIRRQTLVNNERYTTEELKQLEEELLTAADRRKSMEYELFQDLRKEVAESRPRILFMAQLLAALDVWQGLAETARKNNWVKPNLHNGLDIVIREGRHPVVEAVLGAARFIPNDLRMDYTRRILLITGPNMAGKSTVLRQTALICILAQMGSFVPAREASIGIADRVFCRVGASDNLAQGQSTFMVEMMETARILRQATRKSLVILDEIGRGTSTFDGLALAWAVVEDLVGKGQAGIRTLFATHYHELTVLEGKLPGVHNMNIAITEHGNEIVFLRRLVPGPADRSYGVEVARLAGVPQPVVARAKQILGELEAKSREGGAKKMPWEIQAQVSLPGMPLTKPQPETSEQVPAPVHPLLISLQDLDVNAITPLDALKMLTEWKMLWGKGNRDA